MKLIISPKVHQEIEEFYDIALLLHETLDEITVLKKKDRLYDSLESLIDYAKIYPDARLLQDWIKNDYQEFICEDFHFAYRIVKSLDGEEFVIVEDARHSFHYHN